MRRLPTTSYLAFPFRIGGDGAVASGRRAHVREQIAQVLFTTPRERVFRPEFGAGVQRLVFEPNATSLWEATKKRLMASLIQALQGEVDPRTLEVAVEPGPEEGTLDILVSYQLAALGEREVHTFQAGVGGTDG
jgi:phage baseplate assembly protein W